MNKILYATDFSKNSVEALNYAIKVAEAHKAELFVLNVFDIPTGWKYPQYDDALKMEEQAVFEAEVKLKEFYLNIKTDLTPHYITAESTSVVSGIMSIIEKYQIDLLVIGARGNSLIKEALFGSASKALIRKSNIPLLVVPHISLVKDFKNVVFASDFQEKDIFVIHKLLEFLKPFESNITIFHVFSEKENEKEATSFEIFKSKFKAEKIKFNSAVSEEFANTLTNFIKENSCDLLVMLEKKRNNLFDLLFHQDNVQIMDFNSNVPLLIFKEQSL